MILTLEFVGALGILVPFAMFQTGRVTQHSVSYLVLNIVGSGILAGLAYVEQQWGFVILQGVWALVAVVNLVRRRPAGPSRRR